MSSITDGSISTAKGITAGSTGPSITASSIKSVLLLAGAFTFSFLLGEAVHEFGHYLAHVTYGNQNVQVYLDPFGGSKILGVTGFQTPMVGAITAAAGPLFNLLLASVFFFLLWRKRTTWLLPLLLWGPVAMVQEGINFSMGLLTPGGDARWMVSTGLPAPFLATLGVVLLLSGIFLITTLLPLAALQLSGPFHRKFSVITIGFCFLMGIRLIHSLLSPGQQLMENLAPFVFSIFLSSLVVIFSCKLKGLVENRASKPPQPISWRAALVILSAGIVMFGLQMFIC
jgi:hypothetical protein